MADFPGIDALSFRQADVFSSAGAMIGMTTGSSPSSTAWPAANLAIFTPIRLALPGIVYQIVVGCGATATGNFDAGVYDAHGHLLVSTGATAKAASDEVIVNVTDTFLGKGLYYMALSADGTINFMALTINTTQKTRLAGVLNMATAYPLPSTATFAAAGYQYVPNMALLMRG